MRVRSIRSVVLPVSFVFAALAFVPVAAHAKELKGKAILAHPCGKVAVEHMRLVHDGKVEESIKLGTKPMQEEWAAMPKEDRDMMSGMMKEMSVTKEAHSESIEKFGALVLEGSGGTLTIVKVTNDENGSSTETTTQKYELDGDVCRISR